jgi:hypothetical protein
LIDQSRAAFAGLGGCAACWLFGTTSNWLFGTPSCAFFLLKTRVFVHFDRQKPLQKRSKILCRLEGMLAHAGTAGDRIIRPSFLRAMC